MSNVSTTDSIKRRYSFTLVSQGVRITLSAITAALVPRALGPAIFGNFNYLLSTSSTLRGLLEPSADQAFFTFSSQNKQTGEITRLYSLVLFGQFLLVSLFIALAVLTGHLHLVWPGQRLDQIILVTILDWLTFLGTSLSSLGDSKGLTSISQKIGTGVSFVTIAGLVGLAYTGKLTLYSYILLNMTAGLILAALLGYALLVKHADLCWTGSIKNQVRQTVQRWWRFASPILAYEYYAPALAFFSIYLIQRWYGSEEQGYYALALRLSSLAMVFSTASIMICWREIAFHANHHDLPRAGAVYLRFTRFLFFLSVAIAMWLSISSAAFVPLLAGPQYLRAVPVLALMAFYPVAQMYGQINSCALKATERTKLYRNISISLSIPDVILTYFLLAKGTARVPGLELGAMGLAYKMVFFNLLALQLYEWSNFKFFGFSYLHGLVEKSAVVFSVSLCAFLVHGLGRLAERAGTGILATLILATLAYVILIGVIVYMHPAFIGFSRDEISAYITYALNWLRRGAGLLPPYSGFGKNT